MKEKEIRDRIQGFLKRTACAVVVPASMGLGLGAGACDRTSLHGSPADAATDLSASLSDAAVTSPDAVVASPDLAFAADLPELLPPYLVVMIPDAQPDVQPIDGASDADARPDAQPDIATPPPPYMVPDAGRDLPAVTPPYLAPSLSAPPSLGGAAPVPPTRSK